MKDRLLLALAYLVVVAGAVIASWSALVLVILLIKGMVATLNR